MKNVMARKSILMCAFALPLLVSAGAFANTRPVAIGASAEPTLQSILSGSSGFGTVSATADQSTASQWSLDNLDLPSGILPTIKVEYAGNAALNQLGLWTGSNEVTVFNGAASTGTIATIIWTSLTGGTVAGGGGVNAGSFSGISASQFGFFLNGANGKLYSDDSKNGGNAMMLAFSSSSTPNDWMFAFEDTVPGDRDFNDMVFRVSDLVTAVPEPEIYAMMAAGLGLMGFVARRRKQQFVAA